MQPNKNIEISQPILIPICKDCMKSLPNMSRNFPILIYCFAGDQLLIMVLCAWQTKLSIHNLLLCWGSDQAPMDFLTKHLSKPFSVIYYFAGGPTMSCVNQAYLKTFPLLVYYCANVRSMPLCLPVDAWLLLYWRSDYTNVFHFLRSHYSAV